MTKRAPLLAGACAVVSLLAFPSNAKTAENVVFHEWGTFTSLQNEWGESIGFLNTDDEPVPAFVHTVSPPSGIRVNPDRELPPRLSKGIPINHSAITMRLETPVLYAYLPEAARHAAFDVKVEFRGGWLTQFYPKAEASPMDFTKKSAYPLYPPPESSLLWQNIKTTKEGASLPATEDEVWLAPREVASLPLTVNGETEKYLFYRGLGYLLPPLRVSRSGDGRTLNLGQLWAESGKINKVWLVDIRLDGTTAWRAGAGWTIPATFSPADYKPDGISRFREELQKALIEDGLFADEAEAMLNTWAESYFRAGGTRLFFLLPREWTDRFLPLSVTFPESTELTESASIVRVMVGRLELISPEQRALIEKIKNGPVPEEIGTIAEKLGPEKWVLLNQGAPLRELGFTPDPVHQAYLDLGRFRNAMLLHEAKTAPSDKLLEFLKAFEIRDESAPKE